MNHLRARSASLAVLILALAGCGSLVPPAGSPQGSLRDTFRTDTVTAEAPLSNAAEASEWDGFFVDAGLRRVVALALAGNRSLRASMAAVDRARAQYGISEAARWPELEGTLSGTRQRNAGGAAGATTGSGTGGNASGSASTSYSVSLGLAAWEIDLFNRLASLEGAALSRFLAQQQTQQNARLTLVTQVAEAWLALSAEVQRVRLADELRASQQRTLNLIERQYQLGAASGLQLARAQTAFEAARAEAAAPVAAPAVAPKQDAQRRQQNNEKARPLKKELDQVDKRLAALQAEKAQLEGKLMTPLPPAEMATTGKRLKAVTDEVETLESRWLELTDAIEAATAG